ncbi:hypothetical protein HUJ05_008405 [Dendroctonus ponderosae]|nr:hypothetical protein HUJ05_008405 [Dendroctonus ponderosae]
MVQIQESNFLLPARTPFAVVPLISQPLNDSRDSYLIIGFSIVGRIGVWIIAENGKHGSDFCHVSHHIIWNVAHPFAGVGAHLVSARVECNQTISTKLRRFAGHKSLNPNAN